MTLKGAIEAAARKNDRRKMLSLIKIPLEGCMNVMAAVYERHKPESLITIPLDGCVSRHFAFRE